jgi:hypothetical protein
MEAARRLVLLRLLASEAVEVEPPGPLTHAQLAPFLDGADEEFLALSRSGLRRRHAFRPPEP